MISPFSSIWNLYCGPVVGCQVRKWLKRLYKAIVTLFLSLLYLSFFLRLRLEHIGGTNFCAYVWNAVLHYRNAIQVFVEPLILVYINVTYGVILIWFSLHLFFSYVVIGYHLLSGIFRIWLIFLFICPSVMFIFIKSLACICSFNVSNTFLFLIIQHLSWLRLLHRLVIRLGGFLIFSLNAFEMVSLLYLTKQQLLSFREYANLATPSLSKRKYSLACSQSPAPFRVKLRCSKVYYLDIW